MDRDPGLRMKPLCLERWAGGEESCFWMLWVRTNWYVARTEYLRWLLPGAPRHQALLWVFMLPWQAVPVCRLLRRYLSKQQDLDLNKLHMHISGGVFPDVYIDAKIRTSCSKCSLAMFGLCGMQYQLILSYTEACSLTGIGALSSRVICKTGQALVQHFLTVLCKGSFLQRKMVGL